jgi:phospholipid/cholesterol/gamma-HCH transport system substrate-binding protein
MNRKRSELLVGLFLFVGLCLLAAMILKFGNFGDAFHARYVLELSYPTAGGLTKGSEVKFSGVTIGRVQSAPMPNSDFTGAVIQLSIFEEYRIPASSKISIESAGLLGDSYIAITPPKLPSGTFLADGAKVVGSPPGGLIALADSAGDLSERGKEVVDDMRTALRELNSALEKLDSSILGEENLNHFNTTVVGLSDAVKNLNDEVLGEANSDNLRVALENLRKTSENLAEQSEKIAPLLSTAQGAVTRADEGIGEIADAARTANSAIHRVTDGSGLFAALINDSVLRDDFEALVENIRKNGILFYRDTAGTDSSGRDSKIPRSKRKGLLRK